MPAGTGQITWTQTQAQAAFATLECTNKQQLNRVADFAPSSWALGCGTTGSPYKYLLMPAAVKGTSIKSASAQPQTSSSGSTSFATGQWEVTISFKDDSFQKFTDTTKGGTLQGAIVLDGVVESAPTNQDVIASDAQITGNFTEQTASDLANVLKYGSLPLTFQDSPQTETISATLGKSSLHSGLLAGAIGIGIVLLYCFFYYRALGIVTILSLGVSGAMIYACICLLGKGIGLTLSLPGIAGFIVAVGITADSFVVYFERLKDEIKEGRTPRSAVDRAWVRARRTILSADTVSFLAAIILYFVSVGGVRGFAFTLGLSTLLDVVVVFLFTRPLVSYLSRYRWFSRSRPTGFHGPDGGEPVTTAASAGARRRAATVPDEAVDDELPVGATTSLRKA